MSVLPQLATTLYALIQFGGCSLISFTFEAAMDVSRPDEYIFTASAVDSIKRGSSVDVVRLDGSIVPEDFEGRGFSASEEYAERYKQAIDSLPNGMTMPALGDSIVIVTHGTLGRNTLAATLLGLDTGIMRVDLPGWKQPAGVFVESVDTIRYGNSHFVTGDALRQLMSNGQVPLNSAIFITNKQGTHAVQLSEILVVREPIGHDEKWGGLGVGLAIDIVAILVIKQLGPGPLFR
jgi:hypothetical protein